MLALLATAAAHAQEPGIQFRDVTQASGIHFVHNNGAFGKKYLPETLGPGCAFLDYDNDGAQDIL
ncbi:MAG: CRTAC1 family protein, partial [Nevskiales bacterium]